MRVAGGRPQGGKHARTCRICDRDDAVKPSSLFSKPAGQLFECCAAGQDRDDAVKLSSLLSEPAGQLFECYAAGKGSNNTDIRCSLVRS